MRKAIITAVLAVIVLFAGVGMATAQGANDPIATAGGALKTNPVYVAPNSGNDISASDQDALRGLISKARVPIYIAILPESATGQVGGADNLPHAVAVAAGNPKGVFGVVSGHSFRAGASNGVGLAAGQASSLAGSAISSNNPATLGSVLPALKNFVSRVTAATTSNSPAGVATGGTTVAPKSSSSNAGKIVLGIIAGILLLGVGVVCIYYLNKVGKAKKALISRHNSLKRRLEDMSGAVLDLEAKATLNDNAKASYSNAANAYQSANARFTQDADNEVLDDVEHYLVIAEAAMDDARDYINGIDPHPVVSAVIDTTPRVIPAAQVTKAAPTQTSTVVNNYNGQSSGYWQGSYPGRGYGYYPGFGWGYYGYNGDFVTGMLVAEMMEDRNDRYDNDHQPAYSGGSQDTTASSTGDWSSSSGSTDSGSGDWNSSPDPSPSYDSGSSDSGGDWGGGGGFDSGGSGGFDSGNSGGGGDW